MLTEFYGLQCNPFDKSRLKPSGAFISQDHQQMIQRLEYLKTYGSIGVFTAPPGMGKTFALRCFMDSLNPNLNVIAYIPLTTVPVTEFYGNICDALGLERAARKSVMFKEIGEYILTLYKEKRKPLILAIDEAQHLDPRILIDLKMLLNHEYDSKSCFSLVLLGEPQLNFTLQKPVYEALRQRITVSYSFTGMSVQETEEYLTHKLKAAGGMLSILDPAAVHAVRSIAHGCPRKIDILMTHALTVGSQLKKNPIDAEVIRIAADGNIALK